MKRYIKRIVHHAICWYLRRCGSAFHTYPYGEEGRYVVLMDEQQYHNYAARARDA